MIGQPEGVIGGFMNVRRLYAATAMVAVFSVFAGHEAALAASPVFTTIYRFDGTTAARPQAGVTIDPAGTGALFGVTTIGGTNGAGTVFRLRRPAPGKTVWRFTILYNFRGNGGNVDGRVPVAELLIRPDNGTIYGTTAYGGTLDFGTVFRLQPPPTGQTTWSEKVLLDLAGQPAMGANPHGALIFDGSGGLVGTTLLGGKYNLGTAFHLLPPGPGGTTWKFRDLHDFGATAADGTQPNAPLVRDPSSGILYGTSTAGGAHNAGSVFSVKTVAKVGPVSTTIHSFTGGNDGSTPNGNLVIGPDGSFYGTAAIGGANGTGVAFKLVPPTGTGTKWTYRVLHQFLGGINDGAQPKGLTLGSDGKLYGTTLYGGGSSICGGGCGTVYQLTPPPAGGQNWKFTLLHRFTGRTDSAAPQGMLAVDTSDNDTLYGTATGGYTDSDFGTVFRLKH